MVGARRRLALRIRPNRANLRFQIPASRGKSVQMTFIKQSGGLLRPVRRSGVPGLLLALAVTLGSGGVASAVPRTINLNTGYDQWSSTAIGPGQQDNEWRVTSPPLNGGAAFAAFVVNTNLGWTVTGSFPPNTRWISINPTATPLTPATTSYDYKFYFTLPPGFSAATLKMKLSSDDQITKVTLNSCPPFPTSPGGSFSPPPLSVSTANQSCFESGSKVNVITVTVDDTLEVVTGLIVDGAVTYEDCDRLPVASIPNVSTITFFESTFATPTSNKFQIFPGPDPKLTTRIPGSLSGLSNDFVGFVGATELEVYDVFFSDWSGNPIASGQFVTIEAVANVGAPKGGGLNIAAVQLDFGSGHTLRADFVSSFVALGDNAIPQDVGKAVDPDPNPTDPTTMTDTTMGNTIGQTTQRLRVTVGFPCLCTPRPPQSGCLRPLPKGMAAWWPLDGLNSSGKYDDLAGGDNNGTPIGSPSPILNQYVGNSIQAGIGKYVEVSDAPPNLNFGLGSFTIDSWVKFTPGTQTEPIVYKLAGPSGSGGGYFLSIGAVGTQWRPQLQIATKVYLGPIITAPQGTWLFVAATVNKSSSSSGLVNLYAGVPPGPLAVFSPPAGGAFSASSPGTPLWIGGWQGNPHASLGIDELEIFKRALSRKEIKSIFDAGSAGKCKVPIVPIDINPGSSPNGINP